MNRMIRAAIRVYGTLAPSHAARWFERALLTPRPVRGEPFPNPRSPGKSGRLVHGGVGLAVTTFGAGPTVLLLHGWGGTSASFGAFVDPLVEAGHRVVTCDLPAHGRSDGIRTNIIEAAGAVRVVGQAFGPLAAIVTHSFGGPVVALALARGLEAERVAMIAPPRSIPALSFAVADAIGLPRGTADLMFRRFAQRFRFEWNEIETDHLVRRLAVPLLVIHDEEDPKVPWSHGAQIAHAAPGGRLVTTNGLGHRDVLHHPTVIRQVVTFVVGGWADTARRIA
jgi:pimeloyl-ACP methyl ester carboxylesterase